MVTRCKGQLSSLFGMVAGLLEGVALPVGVALAVEESLIVQGPLLNCEDLKDVNLHLDDPLLPKAHESWQQQDRHGIAIGNADSPWIAPLQRIGGGPRLCTPM